ncbi:hypothetical protein T4E_11847 [Trichinella pseudospiralis]|uniref:Uncharacterized protein n=1 Tax=Trichinella pseudospiralis TaxID=6337 RepID=A0A0V0YKX8_TRIPS|nr:hypothetical protein T4E_11847 [Trichinella pseudospiralis]
MLSSQARTKINADGEDRRVNPKTQAIHQSRQAVRYKFIAVKEDENIDVNVSDEPNEGPSHSEASSCLTDGLK